MGDISLLQLVVILVAGALSGFVNTMAGGGSFITLVALQFAGLSTTMANGTNRVAVEVQNIMAILGFRSKGVSNLRQGLHFAIPALFGAIAGAYIAVDLPDLIFRRVLAVAMILMLLSIIFNAKKWLKERAVEMTPKRRWIAYPIFFAIGFYGGAIQAGVGFLLIAALVLVAGEDLVHTNSYKVFIIATYTLFALGLFAWRGQVNWVYGLLLSVGDGAGAWIASRLAVSKGDKIVRVVLGVMLAVMAVRYLDIIPGF